MVACLVQQLFRLKIGKELDPILIEEILFHLLRPRKHPSKELLLDIKALRIMIVGGGWRSVMSGLNVLTFTSTKDLIETSNRRVPQPYYFSAVEGKLGSKLRRRKFRLSNWGAIDIINDLRELNYPQIGYRPTLDPDVGRTEYEFGDAYIRLEEDHSLPPIRGWASAPALVGQRAKFVNDFLEDYLVSGKRLTWDGGVLGWEPCRLPLHPPFEF